MSDDGYTLVETLTAMAILSLAVGGLAAASQAFGRIHWTTEQSIGGDWRLRQAEGALQDLLAKGGPYRSHLAETFAGNEEGFRFDCQEAEPCQVRLVEAAAGAQIKVTSAAGTRSFALGRREGVQILYQGSNHASLAWPTAAPERQTLRAILLTADEPGGPALLAARIWTEQPETCAFDPVLKDCR